MSTSVQNPYEFPDTISSFVKSVVHKNFTTVIDYFGNKFIDIRLDLKTCLQNVPTELINPVDEAALRLKVNPTDVESVLDDKLSQWYGFDKVILNPSDNEQLELTIDLPDAFALSQLAGTGYINDPNIMSPSNNDVLGVSSVDVVSSPYMTTMLVENHISTDWQVSTTPGFSTIIVDINSVTDLTTATLALQGDGNYYIRCRYRSTTKVSNWTNSVIVVVALPRIDDPYITSPVNGEVDVTGSSLITSSAYAPVNHNEPHLSTDWQVATDAGFTNIVFQSLADTAHLIGIGTVKLLMGLLESTEYYVRCKYNSATCNSDWSAAVHFTTSNVFLFKGTQKLIASDGAAVDYFGSSSAISEDGSTVAIGARLVDAINLNEGAIYVFKWNNSTFEYDEVQKLVYANSGGMGITCSISDDGSVIVAGAISSGSAGAAYVFKWNTGTSQYDAIQMLTASDGAAEDWFGISCSISDDSSTIAVGAHGDDDKGSESGSVYVFKWNSGTSQYDEIQKLTASDGAADDYFGYSCAMDNDGSTIIVAARMDNGDSGSAYAFKWNTGTSQYDEVQKLTASDAAAVDYFGASCAISDDASVVIIGAHGDDDNGYNSGSVYVFKWNSGTSQYDQAQKLTPNSGEAYDYFGDGCAMSSDGSVVVITGYNSNDSSAYAGSSHVFEWNSVTSQYDEIQDVVVDGSGNNYPWSGSGCSMSDDGSVIIVNAVRDDETATSSGAVYVFM